MTIKNFYEDIGVEYDIIVERFCGDENMLSMFVCSFPEDPTYQNLVNAVEKLNNFEIENYAHALKGLSANLAFIKLQSACAQVVNCVRQNKADKIPENFGEVKIEYENIVKLIELIK